MHLAQHCSLHIAGKRFGHHTQRYDVALVVQVIECRVSFDYMLARICNAPQ
jgi:hypothetical protein